MNIHRMLSWLITTKAHAVVSFDNEGLTYSPKDEETFNAVYALIESSSPSGNKAEGEKSGMWGVDLSGTQGARVSNLVFPAPSPGPLPAEVEEAMDIIGFCRSNYVSPAEWDAALAVIRAALRPKVLTRELVDECIARLDGAAQRFPGSCAIDFEYIIRELGFVVGEKP